MASIVKMEVDDTNIEVPEVTVNDIYLDIAEAEENADAEKAEGEENVDEEDMEPSDLPVSQSEYPEGGRHPQLPLQDGSGFSCGYEPRANTGVSRGGEREGVLSESVKGGSMSVQNDTDNDEIDVDTPFDGRLFGQTTPKPTSSISEKHPTLMSTLFSFAHSSKPLKNVAKKSTSKPFVPSIGRDVIAIGSTITKGPVIAEGSKSGPKAVAKKSTTKQARPSVTTPMTAKTNSRPRGVLQVKFGPAASPKKSAPNVKGNAAQKVFPPRPPSSPSKTNHATNSLPFILKKKVPFPGNRPEDLEIPLTNTSVFRCDLKSNEKIPCPECNIMLTQYSIRAHLKKMHNLPMRFCKKCRLFFTDMNFFGEHYALHLQQEEDLKAGISTSPVQLNLAAVASLPGQNRSSPKSFKTTQRQISPATSQACSSNSKDSVEKMSLSTKLSSPSYHKPHPESPKVCKKTTPTPSPKSKSVIINIPVFPVQPKLPPKPRKPVSLKKRPKSAQASKVQFQSPNIYKSNQNTKSPTSASLKSDVPSKADTAENRRVGPHTSYRENQKAANRKGRTVASPSPMPSPKKHRPAESFTGLVSSSKPVAHVNSRQQVEQPSVRLVSLEMASRPYDCKTCLASFKSALACPRSFRKLSQNKPFVCNKCGAMFDQAVYLDRHQGKDCSVLVDSSSTVVIKDAKPSDLLSDNIELESQVVFNDSGVRYECSVCKENFQYRSHLLRHITYHTFQYSCGICKKAFRNKVDLLDHLQIVHDGRFRLRCRYCESRFEDIAEFESHIHAHKSGTVVPCTVCNETFGNSSKFLLHMNIVHDQNLRSVALTGFGKALPQKKQFLSTQMQMKATSKPTVTKFLSCRICRKVFHRAQGLASHYRQCHGTTIKDAIEAIKAKKSISHSSHMHGGNPNGGMSNTLQKKVLGRVANQCTVCFKTFRSKRTLVQHYRALHGVELSGDQSRVRRCKICSKIVFTDLGLKMHYKKFHKNLVPAEKAANQGGSETSQYKVSSKVAPYKSGAETERFVCNKCGKGYFYLSCLYRHTRLFHPQPTVPKTASVVKKATFTCSVCVRPFKSKKSMRMHVSTQHPESFQDERVGSRKCKKCGKTCTSQRGLLFHSNMCKGPNSRIRNDYRKPGDFPCSLCDRVFRWKSNVVRHLQINHGMTKTDLKYKHVHRTDFPKMPRQINHGMTKTDLGHNMKYSHVDRTDFPKIARQKYLCKACKTCFPSLKPYKRHRQRVHNSSYKFFQCRYRGCKKVFVRSDSLSSHIKGSHPNMSQYLCSGCKRGYNTLSSVLSHVCLPAREQTKAPSSVKIQDNTGQQDVESRFPRPQAKECRYRCMTCGLGFHIAREWTKHVQEHAEKAELGAPSYDQVMDATNNIRLNIFDVMSTDNLSTCNACGKMFTDEDALAKHACMSSTAQRSTLSKFQHSAKITNNTGDRVQCKVCFKFFLPSSIRKHLMYIHALKMRTCKTCNLIFTDLEDYRKHCQSHSSQIDTLSNDDSSLFVNDSVHNPSTFAIETSGLSEDLPTESQETFNDAVMGESSEPRGFSQAFGLTQDRLCHIDDVNDENVTEEHTSFQIVSADRSSQEYNTEGIQYADKQFDYYISLNNEDKDTEQTDGLDNSDSGDFQQESCFEDSHRDLESTKEDSSLENLPQTEGDDCYPGNPPPFEGNNCYQHLQNPRQTEGEDCYLKSPLQTEGNDSCPENPPQTDGNDCYTENPPQSEGVDYLENPSHTEGSDCNPENTSQTEGDDYCKENPPQSEGNDCYSENPSQTEGDDSCPENPPQTEGNDRYPENPPQTEGDDCYPGELSQSEGNGCYPENPPQTEGNDCYPENPPPTEGSDFYRENPPPAEGNNETTEKHQTCDKVAKERGLLNEDTVRTELPVDLPSQVEGGNVQ